MTSRRAAVLFALLSPVFTIGVLIWMGSRPPHYFADQGGLLVMFFYFPLTFGVWVLSALLSAFSVPVVHAKGRTRCLTLSGGASAC